MRKGLATVVGPSHGAPCPAIGPWLRVGGGPGTCGVLERWCDFLAVVTLKHEKPISRMCGEKALDDRRPDRNRLRIIDEQVTFLLEGRK